MLAPRNWILFWNGMKKTSCFKAQHLSARWLQTLNVIRNSEEETHTARVKRYFKEDFWMSYCWWLKSCTTWDVWNPKNNGKNYLSTGAGFRPSTVVVNGSHSGIRDAPTPFPTFTDHPNDLFWKRETSPIKPPCAFMLEFWLLLKWPESQYKS